MALFITRQLLLQRADRALLDLRAFTSLNFPISVATTFITMMALFGAVILLPIYARSVLGMEPLVAGLLLLLGGMLMGILGRISGRIYDRRDLRVLLVPGALLVSASFWGLSFGTETTPLYFVLAAHIVLSLGLSLMFTRC